MQNNGGCEKVLLDPLGAIRILIASIVYFWSSYEISRAQPCLLSSLDTFLEVRFLTKPVGT